MTRTASRPTLCNVAAAPCAAWSRTSRRARIPWPICGYARADGSYRRSCAVAVATVALIGTLRAEVTAVTILERSAFHELDAERDAERSVARARVAHERFRGVCVRTSRT